MLVQKRLISLDLLRGVAILLVLGFHSLPSPAGILAPFAHILTVIGWSGVDLFFVLSGFLVGGLLFHEIRKSGRLDVTRFIIRRGFKIWPLYYLFLVIGVVYRAKGMHIGLAASARSTWPNWLHVQNYFGTPFGVTWSLAVEEHFYLFLPLLLAILVWASRDSRVSLPLLPWIVGVVAVTCFVLRWVFPQEWVPAGYTHLRMDSMFAGVLLAYLHYFRPSTFNITSRHPLLFIALGCVMLLPLCHFKQDSRFTWTIGHVLAYCGYGLILISTVHGFAGPRAAWLENPVVRAVAFIGVYSYPIYLWHIGLGQRPSHWLLDHGVFSRWSTLQWITVNGVWIVFMIVVGVTLSKLVEFPMLALRDRLYPSRATTIDARQPKSEPDEVRAIGGSQGDGRAPETVLQG
jgi:peptidoglycan/LPS O-acetylase OafA/YrhL